MTMFHIASATPGNGTAVTFANISQTFSHLQLRIFGRGASATSTASVGITINNDNTANIYYLHELIGNGSSPTSSATPNNQFTTFGNRTTGSTATANVFGNFIIDILDYTNTSKNKTLRSIGGVDLNGSGTVGLNSGLYLSTAAVSSLLINSDGGWAAGSRIDLYGITTSSVTGA